MFSKNHKALTPAQVTSDDLFIKSIEDDFINPIISELAECIPSFSDMDFFSRYANVIRLNEPYFEKGDSLELPETPTGLGMLVYAGDRLGKAQTSVFKSAEITISQYRPRFKSNFVFGSCANGTALVPDVEHPEEESAIKLFLHHERATFDSLPVSYRAALLVQYICENMVVVPSDATRFVLGLEQKSPSQRWIARRTENAQIQGNGWLVRIRDNKPGNELIKDIGSTLRSSTEEVISLHGQDSVEQQTNKRATKSGPDAVYSYIDSMYLARHVYIGAVNKGNEKSWADVLADVMENVEGCHDYSGDPYNLKRGYEKNRGKYPYSYKKKRGNSRAAAGGASHG